MIFVTVGTQLPFDRLIAAIDQWARAHPEEKVFGQIATGGYLPAHFEYEAFLSPVKADACMREAEIIVSHAGMGSILTALRYRKPILILPRKACYGEHRNDHQMATAKWIEHRPGIFIAGEAEDIGALLDDRSRLVNGDGIDAVAQDQLIQRLRGYIEQIRPQHWMRSAAERE